MHFSGNKLLIYCTIYMGSFLYHFITEIIIWLRYWCFILTFQGSTFRSCYPRVHLKTCFPHHFQDLPPSLPPPSPSPPPPPSGASYGAPRNVNINMRVRAPALGTGLFTSNPGVDSRFSLESGWLYLSFIILTSRPRKLHKPVSDYLSIY